jgi:hypothetical protein
LDKPNDTPRFRPRRPSPGRLALLALGLFALLALVAAASRAHHTPGGHAGIHSPPSGVGDYLFSIFVVVMAGGLLLLIWLWFSERDLLAERRHQHRGSFRALFLLALIAATVAIVTRVSWLHPRHGRTPLAKLATSAKALQHARKLKGETEAPRFEWLPVFLATGAGLSVLGFVAVRSLRRERRELAESFLLERELEQLITVALGDLYAERDPRKAIIKAYAAVEHVFASHGLPREPSEAPVEYLDRVLPELRASGAALRRLTSLFQWAKFSPHDVEAPMRDEAIEAFEQVRDELRARRIEDEQRQAEAARLVSPRRPIRREPT